VILHGKVADIDLGCVDNIVFTNAIDTGLTVGIAQQTTRKQKQYLGVIAYLLTGLQILFTPHSFLARLEMDGASIVQRVHEIIIANGRVYGETLLAHETTLENRRLLVFTLEVMPRWRRLSFWLAFLLGRHHAFPEMHLYFTSHLHLSTDPVQGLSVDGETILRTPATFTVAPQALKVMAPSSFIDRI